MHPGRGNWQGLPGHGGGDTNLDWRPRREAWSGEDHRARRTATTAGSGEEPTTHDDGATSGCGAPPIRGARWGVSCGTNGRAIKRVGKIKNAFVTKKKMRKRVKKLKRQRVAR